MWIKCSGKWVFEPNVGDEARFKAIDSIVKQVAAGCSEADFLVMRCPVCGAGLFIEVNPTRHVFYVGCSSDTRHVGVHERFEILQDWHTKYVSYGWLDNNSGSQ
jgi:hypothetical protein